MLIVRNKKLMREDVKEDSYGSLTVVGENHFVLLLFKVRSAGRGNTPLHIRSLDLTQDQRSTKVLRPGRRSAGTNH